MKQQLLDRTLLFQIRKAWQQINYQLFNSQLKEPSFELLSNEDLLGQWRSRDRIIAIQKKLILTVPWLEVLETLKHEMAHQFVSEILQVQESAHGPIFRKVCQERQIISKAQAKIEKDPQVIKLLAKVNKLLALAESDNQFEAEQAAQQAQNLLIKHHIKLAELDHFAEDEQLDHMTYQQLGEVKSRYFHYEYSIANLLSDYFFVSTIWVNGFSVSSGKEGRVLEVCGREEDLEIASYVYDFIYNHLKLAWKTYQLETKAKGLKKRLSFSLGLVQGFAQRLAETQKGQSEEHQELIYIGRSLSDRFLAKRYPKIRMKSSNSWSPSHDYHSGFQEGQNLHLRKAIYQGTNHGAVPKRLDLLK